jgi:hypothetical protein
MLMAGGHIPRTSCAFSATRSLRVALKVSNALAGERRQVLHRLAHANLSISLRGSRADVAVDLTSADVSGSAAPSHPHRRIDHHHL